MKIAILGSRGVPNLYGGFEQFAEFVSVGLARRGHDVTVYNADYHPFSESHYQGVEIVKKWCPEKFFGSAAHFIYDFLCLRDAVARDFDIALELGYGTSALSFRLCRTDAVSIVTNMDGMEWQRDKWGLLTKAFTRWLEKEGATLSDYIVADNPGIQEYLWERYGRQSTMISYGADVFDGPDEKAIKAWNLAPRNYYLLIARMEPENNIQTILDGFVASSSQLRFIVVGGTDNRYGRWLAQRYAGTDIEFLGGVYDQAALNNLRFYARLYFHGHSVGGTNPSLLEAMAANAVIAAHMNRFNSSVLDEDAYYFTTAEDVARLIADQPASAAKEDAFRARNVEKIRSRYSWESIIDQYDRLFKEVVNRAE